MTKKEPTKAELLATIKRQDRAVRSLTKRCTNLQYQLDALNQGAVNAVAALVAEGDVGVVHVTQEGLPDVGDLSQELPNPFAGGAFPWDK